MPEHEREVHSPCGRPRIAPGGGSGGRSDGTRNRGSGAGDGGQPDRGRGIGLAAPQIGISQRVILISVPAARRSDDPDDGPLPLTALVNPELTPIGDERALGMEGCLSIPGMRGEVERWLRVRLTAVTPEGRPVDAVMTGMRARVLQHEVDHLDGVLYLDRMTDFTRFGYVEELLEAEMRTAPLRTETVAPEDAGAQEQADAR
ncbi:MAG: peptide deformylase [Thalassobaculum sp.]